LVVSDERHAPVVSRVDAPQVVVWSAAIDAPPSVGAWMSPLSLPDPAPPVTVAESTPAMLFCTGGTTGVPKASVHTHRSLALYCAVQPHNGMRVADDVELCITPFFHVSFVTGPLTTLSVGGTTIVHPRFDPAEVASVFERGEATVMFGTPVHYQSILAVAGFGGAPGVRHLTTGGASATPDLIEAMLGAFPNATLSSGYGASELGLVAVAHHRDLVAGRLTGVGRPGPGVLVEARDPVTGEPVATGESGELLISAPWQATGYWRQPAETASTFVDGAVAIGDVGSLEPDGWLTLRGRKKEMILSGGENIFPNEVEAVLAGHPDVAQVAVYGVPDDRWGERLEAAVVLRPGRISMSAADLGSFASEDLGRYKLPKVVRVYEALPRTPIDKIDRIELRRLATDEGSVSV
jgi:acyl-CoA synthetase (AMP-forming)/AMP-acid ligase II